MKDYEENALLEAATIIIEALNDLVVHPIEWGEDLMPYLRAEEILNHASTYIEDQMPPNLRAMMRHY